MFNFAHQLKSQNQNFHLLRWKNLRSIFFSVLKITYDVSSLHQSNLSLFSLHYVETCNKLAWPISMSLCPGNTAPFEEMLQRWRAVGNTVSNLTGTKFEPQISRSRDKRVTARQLDGQAQCSLFIMNLSIILLLNSYDFDGWLFIVVAYNLFKIKHK